MILKSLKIVAKLERFDKKMPHVQLANIQVWSWVHSAQRHPLIRGKAQKKQAAAILFAKITQTCYSQEKSTTSEKLKDYAILHSASSAAHFERGFICSFANCRIVNKSISRTWKTTFNFHRMHHSIELQFSSESWFVYPETFLRGKISTVQEQMLESLSTAQVNTAALGCIRAIEVWKKLKGIEEAKKRD